MADEPDPAWTEPLDIVAEWLARTARGDWPPGRYTESLDLTPDVARFLLASVDPNYQRQSSDNWVRSLVGIILRGEFRHGDSEATFEGHPGSPDFRNLNARHRMQALMLASEVDPMVSIPITLAFGCNPDEAEVIDTGRGRSLADTLDFTTGQSEPGNRNVAAAVKLAWHLDAGTWASRLPSPSRVQELDYLKQHPDLVDAVAQALPVRRELHGPIAGYACAFWLISSSPRAGQLADFIEGFTFAEDVKRTHPFHALNRTLLDAYAKRITGPSDQRRGWWYAAVIVKAWNDHVTGKAAPKDGYTFQRQDVFPECL